MPNQSEWLGIFQPGPGVRAPNRFNRFVWKYSQTDPILSRDAFWTVLMDGRWAKYWFIIVWPIKAWSSDLFASIRALTNHRCLNHNGLHSRRASGTSKYHQSSAEYVSTFLYSLAIASLISASRIAREAPSFVLWRTEFQWSHISWAKSHNSITA
jgi:hypothetical protein